MRKTLFLFAFFLTLNAQSISSDQLDKLTFKIRRIVMFKLSKISRSGHLTRQVEVRHAIFAVAVSDRGLEKTHKH